MADRAARTASFVAGAGWGAARRGPLAGDASNRRYERLTDARSGASAVLMDAPPDRGEDIGPFCRVAEHLHALGLSAPAILARDPDAGLLLLEDLGDDLIARIAARDPDRQRSLYEGSTDVLIALHDNAPPEGLKRYDPILMADLAGLALTEYRDAVTGAARPQVHRRFMERFEDILSTEIHGPNVIVLRDYHAENLLWLPDREGPARIGLLDFQDAMLGHPAYDLVSLLQDARRDVPVAIEMAMIDRYIAARGVDDHLFRTAYAVLGAQRHLRVLGVFARLCTRDGKPRYLDWIPRVHGLLMTALEHPALAPVADLLRQELPPPDAETLAILRDKCPTR